MTVDELLADEALLDPYLAARVNSPLGDGPTTPEPVGDDE